MMEKNERLTHLVKPWNLQKKNTDIRERYVSKRAGLHSGREIPGLGRAKLCGGKPEKVNELYREIYWFSLICREIRMESASLVTKQRKASGLTDRQIKCGTC